MTLFIFKFLFIFSAYFTLVLSGDITYTIDVHSINVDEPYEAVFLDDGDKLHITCGQDNIELKEIKTYNKSEKNDAVVLSFFSNPFEITFKSTYQNGNLIVCGGKSKTTGESMTGVVRLLTTLNKPFYKNWLSCDDKGFCQNHGQCYVDPENHATKICVCSSHFAGNQCQNMAIGMHVRGEYVTPKNLADANSFTFIVIIVILSLATLFIGGIAFYYRHNHKQEQKLRRLLVCSKCNKTRCEAKSDDETQTSDGIRTNNKKEYNKLPQNIP